MIQIIFQNMIIFFKNFLKVTKNNEINKKFIISNAQPNLNEFTKSEKGLLKKIFN